MKLIRMKEIYKRTAKKLNDYMKSERNIFTYRNKQ